MDRRIGSTRDIARTAVRDRLAAVAVAEFAEHGFDNVTVADLAERAGVSKSTFLRHFRSKEDALLCAYDDQGAELQALLAARPVEEDAWASLRSALSTLLAGHLTDPAEALRLQRLGRSTASLGSGRLEKHEEWAKALALTLRERGTERSTVSDQALAGSALACFRAALDGWDASEGRLDPQDLLMQAFASVRS